MRQPQTTSLTTTRMSFFPPRIGSLPLSRGDAADTVILGINNHSRIVLFERGREMKGGGGVADDIGGEDGGGRGGMNEQLSSLRGGRGR